MKKFLIFIVIALLFILLTFIEFKVTAPEREYNQIGYDNIMAEPAQNSYPIFNAKDIPDEIYSKMLGKSIPLKYKDKVDISTLSYLHISYFGFDNDYHVGEMIVNKSVAKDVLEVFKELYDIRYPIEKIRLIDEYDANDEVSMADNNTSCFCFRVIAGSASLSNHAMGLAIDLNPLYNPYVYGKTVSPSAGLYYVDRAKSFNYKINKEDAAYKIFVSHGWSWGR